MCDIHSKSWDNGIKEKIRICVTSCANKFLHAAIYLKDEVFIKIADLEEEIRVFNAGLYYLRVALKVA